MSGEPSSVPDEVRAAEVIASLCLATDLGIGLPYEHGLQSTLFAMRLAERLGVGPEVASQTYYGCLLFYAGCTVDAELTAELFDDGELLTHFNPVIFGTPAQTMAGIVRALAGSRGTPPVRALRVATRLPRAVRGHRGHLAALCEVAQMLSDRLGLPPAVRNLFVHLTERWDGKGQPAGLRGQDVPLPLRIVHIARDAALQRLVGGEDYAARVVRERAGGAFDPVIAARLADEANDILALDGERSAWDEVLHIEPTPRPVLRGEAIDRALGAMGDFADLASRYLVGHAAGVAELAGAAAVRADLPAADVVAVRRAALVHDVGRVAVSVRIWQKAAPLTPDEWEQVRLHAYHSERVLCRSPFLAALARIATFHHERLDGAGYHRGAAAAALTSAARLLAAADAYHAMIEPRPHRDALAPEEAAKLLEQEAHAGRLDADSIAAVLEAAGHSSPHIARPAGLTDREAEVVGLLARGLQTKQIARALGISVKTADRHIQNAYAKIGVSTRAAATLFAMQHGLATWGELPIVGALRRS
ncbi:MAG TPA: HD domain-containing phosphohydrolase [Pseudonocardiaceae bacterium]|jgi:HD-GYP domain-containing protein (c-di-GMP phosphodiesterase class II)